MSRATAAGAAVKFSVTAVGTGPFTYQWQRNGAAIAGATGSSYTLGQAAAANDGDRYTVVVGNAGGSSTSAAATLTVFAVPAPAASCTSAAATSTIVTGSATVGKTFGIALAGCTNSLASVSWQQTGGPALAPLAARTQALHLEPTTAGTYQYTATVRDGNGATFSVSPVVVNVAAPTGSGATVLLRTSQAMRAGEQTSMRAWPSNAPSGAYVVWSQVEGPPVELDVRDNLRAIFTAPQVTQDTVLRFRAELRSSTGTPLDRSDAVVVVESLPAPPTGQLFDQASFFASRVYPYKSTSAYANRIVGCVYSPALYFNDATGATNICPLSSLPLIAQTSAAPNLPTVAEVMDRVVVSHDWMGQAFENFLNTQDTHGDFRRLLGSVTAIVIGARVRPAFFWEATGAIYLDADYLWQTPEQRDVISEVPDYRSGYDAELNYTGLWRYVVGNSDAQLSFSPTQRVSRSTDYLIYELGDLLYHELTHANDAYPYAQRAALSLALRPFEANQSAATQSLASGYPLQSQTMFGLALVKFHGVAATADQKALTPTQVGAAFSADRATDEYNYSVDPTSSQPTVSFEDPAMLMEEFWMLFRHSVRRDVAMTNKYLAGLGGNDLLVAWGQRGRIAEASVRPRIKLVASTIAPWLSASDIDAALNAAPPIAMRVGQSWFANLVLPSPLGFRAGFEARPPMAIEDQMRLIERRRHLREDTARAQRDRFARFARQ